MTRRDWMGVLGVATFGTACLYAGALAVGVAPGLLRLWPGVVFFLLIAVLGCASAMIGRRLLNVLGSSLLDTLRTYLDDMSRSDVQRHLEGVINDRADRMAVVLEHHVNALQDQRTGDTVLRAVEEIREANRKILNVMRSDARATEERVVSIQATSEGLAASLDAVILGQRRILNLVRKEASVQPVMDKLTVVERRLVSSIESGALTLTDELRQAVEVAQADLTSRLTSMEALGGQIADVVDRSRSTSAEVPRRDRSMDEVIRVVDATKNGIKALQRNVDRTGIETVRQVEALMQLFARVDPPTRRVPLLGGFAMNPDSVLFLSDLVRAIEPKRVLELGSGSSTVWLASFMEEVGGNIVAIEHLREYFDATTQMISQGDCAKTVDLRLAHLKDVEIGDQIYSWYDMSVLEDLEEIDILVVDGPPESTGESARFPAFPLLRDRLAANAWIVMDDITRAGESDTVEKWLAMDAGLTRDPRSVGRTGLLRYVRADGEH